MIKIILALLVMLIALSSYIIAPILAGGDKLGGLIGEGSVNQNTVIDFVGACPYENCPTLDQ